MGPDDRAAKKRREVERLRGVPAATTIKMGLKLMMLDRKLHEAPEHEGSHRTRR